MHKKIFPIKKGINNRKKEGRKEGEKRGKRKGRKEERKGEERKNKESLQRMTHVFEILYLKTVVPLLFSIC